MSTQYTDYETPHRVAGHPAARLATRNIAPFDHHRLATDWLLQDECIHALRVADPARGRFNPLRESVDEHAPRLWSPTDRGGHGHDRLHVDFQRLLAIYAQWFRCRTPYSVQE